MKYIFALLAFVVVAANAAEPIKEENVGCYLCKMIVSAAKQYADKEEPEVEAELDKLCDKLGSMADVCKEAVKEIVPIVYKYLDQDLSPEEICQAIGLCPAKVALMKLLSSSKTIEPEQLSVECTLCKIIVDAAKQYADKEEPEIEAELDKLCDKLGSNFAAACKAAVKEIIPLVYKYLDGELSPDQICVQIGFCQSKKQVLPVIPKEPFVQFDTTCDICKAIAEAAKQLVDQEEPEIEKYLNELCDQLGGFADECKAAVKEILPMIYKYLDGELSPEGICAQIGLCVSKFVAPVKIMPKPSQFSVECDLCKEIVTVAKQLADQEEPEIEKYLEEFCDNLGSFADQCKAAVKEIVPLIYKYLDGELNPDQICAQIGLCPGKYTKLPVRPAPFGVPCDLCKQIAAAAKQFADKEEPEIENYLNQLCDQLGEYADECKAAVKEILPEIYKYLDGELSPDGICVQIGLCPGKFVAPVKIMPKPSQFNVECDLCKEIVAAAKQLVDQEEPEIEKYLDEFCDQLGSFADQCKSVVKEILPLVFQYLDGELNPEQICAQIGLCSGKYTPAKLPVRPSEFSIECDLCKEIAAAAKQFADKEEPEIEKYLDEVCDHLGAYADQCKAAVKEILPLIYKYLDGELDPDQICAQIGLCPGKQQRPALVKVHLNPRFNPIQFDVSCDICTTLVEVAKQYANEEEPEVKKKLDDECKHLGVLAGFCKDLVNKYIDEIYQYLNTGLSDKEICQKIGLC